MKRKLNKFLTVFLTICAAVCFISACKSEDKLIVKEWSFSIEDGYITGIVEYGSEPIMIIPNEIDGQKVVGIKSIIVNTAWLKEIVIPATVVEIKDYAIIDDGIHDVDIVFEDNSKLERIGKSAIRGLKVSSMILPEGIKEIGQDAFTCSSSFEYNVENNIKYVGSKNNPYMYLVGAESIALLEAKINSSCKFINENAFENCVLVTEVKIPNGVLSIGASAFSGCSDLSKVVIPDSVKYIGERIFDNCNKLEFTVDKNLKYLGNNENPYIYLAGMVESDVDNVTINSNCKFIGDRAFEYCRSESIVIPEGVLGLGEAVIIESSVETIVLPKTLKFISTLKDYRYDVDQLKEVAYNGTTNEWMRISNNGFNFYGANFYSEGNLVEKIKISNVDSFMLSMFNGCGSIINVEISNVKFFIFGAFSNCDNLKSVKIGAGVKELGNRVFNNCKNLTDIEIGVDVEIIGAEAFSLCPNICKVFFKNPNGWSFGRAKINSSDLSNETTAAKLLVVNNSSSDYWIRQVDSANVE